MAKPELGTKRICPSCGTKYYDLKRNPIVCPNCGTIFEAPAPRAAARKAEPKPAPVVEDVAIIEREEGVVSLEEVEEGAPADIGPDIEEDEEVVVPDAEDAVVDTEADDTFLPEEEEEGDDVAGLLDVDAEDEEER